MKYFQQKLSLRSLLVFGLFCWSALPAALQAVEFYEGNPVETVHDVNLEFQGKPYREGRFGQKFTVVAHRPAAKKVFVFSTDARSQKIALQGVQRGSSFIAHRQTA